MTNDKLHEDEFDYHGVTSLAFTNQVKITPRYSEITGQILRHDGQVGSCNGVGGVRSVVRRFGCVAHLRRRIQRIPPSHEASHAPGSPALRADATGARRRGARPIHPA